MSKPSERQIKNAQAIAERKARKADNLTAGWGETLLGVSKKLEEDGGPNISVEELVRLVATGLRSKSKSDKVEHSAEAIVAEIDSTLDLVEMCQSMLHARKTEWRSWLRALNEGVKVSSDGRKDLKEKVRFAIHQKNCPLKFDIGLLVIEVHGVSVAERQSNFIRFLVESNDSWDWSDVPFAVLEFFSEAQEIIPLRLRHLCRMNDLAATANDPILQHPDELCQIIEGDKDREKQGIITETILRDWISKEPKWPDHESLWWMALQWLPWKVREGTRTKRAAGKRSGQARRRSGKKGQFKEDQP